MSNMKERVEGLDYLAEAASLNTLSDGGDRVVSNHCAALEELCRSGGHGGGESQNMRDLERNHCEESEGNESLEMLKRLWSKFEK